MNDRITALANQADREGNQYGRIYMDYEKFAELIITECAGFLRDTLDDHFAAEQLEQHFGVAEKPVCNHDWYSARNPVVQNGSVCVICGAIDAREPEELKNETP